MESEVSSLVHQFQLKRDFMETGFTSYVASQNTFLDELVSLDLGDFSAQARDFVALQENAKNDFLNRFHDLIETKLLPVMHETTDLATDLDVRIFYTQAKSDPVLNVTDPVWIFFLNSIVALSLNGTSRTSLTRICDFIKNCERWSPDSACLSRQSKAGLEFVLSNRSGRSISIFFISSVTCFRSRGWSSIVVS